LSERTIDVREPDPADAPEPGVPESPYKNLLVPLVVVPFAVVAVLVLVFVFFGAVGGEETGIEENLQRVVNGGLNERKQAAMSLVSQAIENSKARAEGKPEPWPVPGDFQAQLARAWTEVSSDPDLTHRRLAIAQLAALYGDPDALDKLASFLGATEEQDPDGRLRIPALMAMTWLRDERSAAMVIPLLDHRENYIRQVAAAVLQDMPGQATADALARLLGDSSLEMRGQAAVSLSHLGDARGAAVLAELADPASYAAVHAQEPAKYASKKVVADSRQRAVAALARLGRAEDRPLFERLAANDDDPIVRETAMKALGKP
jgi:hypothetical protein